MISCRIVTAASPTGASTPPPAKCGGGVGRRRGRAPAQGVLARRAQRHPDDDPRAVGLHDAAAARCPRAPRRGGAGRTRPIPPPTGSASVLPSGPVPTGSTKPSRRRWTPRPWISRRRRSGCPCRGSRRRLAGRPSSISAVPRATPGRPSGTSAHRSERTSTSSSPRDLRPAGARGRGGPSKRAWRRTARSGGRVAGSTAAGSAAWASWRRVRSWSRPRETARG